MSEDSANTQRKHTRLLIKVNAEVKTNSGLTLSGHTRNLSFGGGFINLDDTSNCESYLGLECQLTLQLGSRDDPILVPVQSKVTRYDSQGIGLEFISTTIEGYWQFKNLMVYNSPESDGLLQELETHPGLEANLSPN
ncbi:MAG: PilZ domain-containing protein [Myxococcota bacterium]|nr:PilZ domain-containing protein [Myxococcota bacterium]